MSIIFNAKTGLFEGPLVRPIRQLVVESNIFVTESSLSKLVGDSPGGQALTNYLHKKHQLSNYAEYTEHPLETGDRVQWREFKWNPDFFMIISGSEGIAGVKPFEEDIRRGERNAAVKNAKAAAAGKPTKPYDPAFDNTLRYQIVAFKQNEMIDPKLLRSLGNPEEKDLDVDPTVMRARGGLPTGGDTRNLDNIFDRLSEFIGKINAIYYAKSRVETSRTGGGDVTIARDPSGKVLPAAKGTVSRTQVGAREREKIATRAGYKTDETTSAIQAVVRSLFPLTESLLRDLRIKARRAKNDAKVASIESALNSDFSDQTDPVVATLKNKLSSIVKDTVSANPELATLLVKGPDRYYNDRYKKREFEKQRGAGPAPSTPIADITVDELKDQRTKILQTIYKKYSASLDIMF